MSFIAQKGADNRDREWCTALFSRLKQIFPGNDKHGGAGGGIGFALERIVGCSVTSGASVILEKVLYGLSPKLIITGEGRLDPQTLGGKTVAAVYDYASRRGIAAVTFCGSMADGVVQCFSMCARWLSSALRPLYNSIENRRSSSAIY